MQDFFYYKNDAYGFLNITKTGNVFLKDKLPKLKLKKYNFFSHNLDPKEHLKKPNWLSRENKLYREISK